MEVYLNFIAQIITGILSALGTGIALNNRMKNLEERQRIAEERCVLHSREKGKMPFSSTIRETI